MLQHAITLHTSTTTLITTTTTQTSPAQYQSLNIGDVFVVESFHNEAHRQIPGCPVKHLPLLFPHLLPHALPPLLCQD